MTAYLSYRLARASVRSLQCVWIVDPTRAWFVDDVSDELATLYPGVAVEPFPPSGRRPDLALIPFMQEECSPRARRRLLRQAARSRPTYLGLYELGKRRLVVVPRRRLPSLLLRLAAEEWLRLAARAPGAVLRRARRLSGEAGVTR